MYMNLALYNRVYIIYSILYIVIHVTQPQGHKNGDLPDYID